MQNLEQREPAFRLLDSGASGVWRQVAEVPVYVAEEADPENDYVQRMNNELWSRHGKARTTVPSASVTRRRTTAVLPQSHSIPATGNLRRSQSEPAHGDL